MKQKRKIEKKNSIALKSRGGSILYIEAIRTKKDDRIIHVADQSRAENILRKGQNKKPPIWSIAEESAGEWTFSEGALIKKASPKKSTSSDSSPGP